jgi:hypothetical protein
MSRPLPYLLAAALAVSLPALSTVPAAAQAQGGVQLIADGHGGDWNDGFRSNDNWRWGGRHHRRDNFRPGISFSFGVPLPQPFAYRYDRPRSRDCYREWDGRVYCRAY